MNIALLKETFPGERRVALIPDAVAKLTQAGLTVLVEHGAGEAAFFSDQAYEQAGARLVNGAAELLAQAEVVVKVGKPAPGEIELLPRDSVLIAMLQALNNPELVLQLAERGVTAFALDMMPRISRAQTMDALTSMSTVAGYKATLLGAAACSKFFPLLMTAAGTVSPAKVLVLGAGVAGLQAIATARRLGAVVEAFDTRPVVKEQVQSLGASFLEIDLGHQDAQDAGGYAKQLSEEAHQREQELIHEHLKQCDVVITTALIPGKPAPILITAPMVADMAPGSIIVDLAAEMGGNCELTSPGETVVREGVTIIGELNLPSTVPTHASQMFSRNICNFLLLVVKDGELRLDFSDEVISGTCVTHNGQVVNDAVRELVRAKEPVAAEAGKRA